MEREIIHMKKALAAGAFLCMALAGCAGGATQAAPAVTHVVTQTATETVTATATATVTVAPQPAEAAAAPAAAAPAVPATAVIPADVAGMNAEALDDDLTALGFEKVIYNSDTGKTVLLLSNWTVTGIDRPGTKQSVDKAVVVHVTK
jgi:hypothetical protein